MAIRIQCIFCESPIAVHDRLSGREVRCPKCNNRLTVPKKSEGLSAKRPGRVTSTSPGPTAPSQAAEQAGRREADAPPLDLGSASIRPKAGDPLSDNSWINDLSRIEPTDSLDWNDEEPPARTRHVARTEEEELEWDVTPMVDVAFLLLIFFMITASFSIQKAIPMAPPQEDTPGQTAVVRETQKFREVFILQIDEFNGYTLIGSDGSESVSGSKQELITQLEDLQVDQTDSVKVLVQAHKMSHHGALVSGLDAARKAGFINFQVQAVDEF